MTRTRREPRPGPRRARARSTRVLTACLAAGALLLAGAGRGTGQSEGTGQPEGTVLGIGKPGAVKDSYIVVLRDDAATAQQTQFLSGQLGVRYDGEVRYTYTATVRGFSVTMPEERARLLAADPAVEYVEQDAVARATGTQDDPTWGLDRVDQEKLPLDSKYTYPNTAPDVTAYVIDTGVHKAHADFGGRAVDGYDFIDDDSTAQDCNGHGTHVAGTIGSATYGVAKGVKLVGVRVLDCQGSGQWSQIIAGVDWVARDASGPVVANLSLGGAADSTVDSAVKRLVAAGVTTVVASGNDNRDACSSSPARTPEAITVNATDSSDDRSEFSNYGSCTDIFAPGTGVTSTWNNGGTRAISGTSMATPHVAGAAALYLSANPSAASATPAAVVKALTDNASAGVVRGPGSGSPNKLLNTAFIGGGDDPACEGGANTEDVAIPDAGEAVTSSITISACAGRGTASTPVEVDIAHPYTADLAVDLVGPSGAVFPLRGAGGPNSSDGIHETFTADTSAEERNGTWKLRVKDVHTYDTGVIEGWSISF
ncbi:S8 family peptidase [Saccharothrix yanglingensis]|uniref:Serine protease n=1 Tax=Saccharothrix yanglingensis TaxID=659496 RepID=A0ABU0X4M5_9PSEU|nr:S8 family peptidase [Saccharothrix yanglingensis]MDQ2585559.1 serine protease [Saccharothrix yanglingensis]